MKIVVLDRPLENPGELDWSALNEFCDVTIYDRSAADQVAELIVKQVSGCPYLRSWREYKTTPYPFSEYWVLQSKWDAQARAALPMFTGRVSIVG